MINEKKAEKIKDWFLLVFSTIIGFILSLTAFSVLLIFILVVFGVL